MLGNARSSFQHGVGRHRGNAAEGRVGLNPHPHAPHPEGEANAMFDDERTLGHFSRSTSTLRWTSARLIGSALGASKPSLTRPGVIATTVTTIRPSPIITCSPGLRS